MPVSTSQIQNAYVAFFNRPADTAGLNYWSSYAGNSADLLTTFAQSSEYTSLFTGLNNTQAVNLIYNNLFGRDADLAGLNYWVGQLTNGSVKIANIADAVNKGAQGTDSTIITSKTTAATAFTTSLDTVAKVVAYSSISTSGLAAVKTWLSGVKDATTLATATSASGLTAITTTVTSNVTSTVAGSTFTLTAGTNNFTGTSGNDTFDGGLTTSSLQTLNSGDSLDGGAGNDELFAVVNGSVTPTVLKNIEKVSITNTAAASVIDFSNSTGITTLTSQGATNTTTLQGIALTLAPTVQDTAFAHTVTFANTTGSSDAATIGIQNVTGGVLTAAGIETLTLNSTGSSTNVLGVPVLANATKLNVTGTAGLTLGTLVTSSALITNVDASALAPTSGIGVTATIAGTSASSISGSSGNDTITITTSAGSDSISGGAGTDSITFTAGFATTDSVDGGAGTDTLNTTAALIVAASATTPTTYTVSNVEVIATTTAHTATSITPANISATANTLNLRGAADTAISAGVALAVVGPAGAFTLGFGRADNTGALGVLGLDTFTITDTGTAITDSITINNNAVRSDTGAQLAVFASSIFNITGYETVTINNGSVGGVAQITGAITLAADAGGTTTLNLTGANNIDLGVVTANVINASALTAAGTAATTTNAAVFMVTNSTATTITGSAGIDNLFGNTTTASSVSGGAGADSITGGSGGDTLLGGAGADSIVSGGGNDSIDAGAGNDNVFMVGTLSAADTIIGGDDTDTLTFDTATAHTAAIGARVSGFETLTAAQAVATLDMSVYSNNTGFTRVNVATGTNSITNAGAAVVTVGSEAAATALTFARATNTSADALNLRLGPTAGTAVTHVAITASGEETITLTNNTTLTSANAQTVTTLSAAALTTLNIAGSGGMIVTNAITGATSLATVVDSRSGANVLTLNLSNSTVATTFTGSANATGQTTLTMGSGANIVNLAGTGNSSITGGSGAESMTGSSGADTFVGGSGNDTLNGGSGADNLSGGSGSDSISAGAGDDTMSTDSGADTIDGGDGTDSLTLSAAFTDLSTDTITNVETLIMGGLAGTMTIANLAAFTTVTTPGIVTLSAAGTIAAGSSVLSYVLADGTNTFTSSTTALDNQVVGGTGSDTFNFGLLSNNTTQSFLAADTITGGTGTDTINFTGNIAFLGATGGVNIPTNVTGVENMVWANTDTNVSITLANTHATTTQSLKLDGSSLTTGVFTVAGVLETDGSLIIVGGGAADILTGGGVADTITGGAGGDSITGGLGIDTIDVGSGDAAVDSVVIGGGLTTDIVSNMLSGTGGDVIQLGLAALKTAGAVAAGITFALDNLADGTTAIVASTSVVQEVADQAGGAAVAAAGVSTIYALLSETYANVAAVETGLETGDHELTVAAGAVTSDAFMVLWSDGTDVYLSSMHLVADNADFAANDLVGTNLVRLVGNTSITAGEFVAGNFAFIT